MPTIEDAIEAVKRSASHWQEAAQYYSDSTMHRRALSDAAALAHALALLEGLRWRPVVGREEQYEVNGLGVIRAVGGCILGEWENGDGYRMVRFSQPRITERVHRVVAMAFIPNPAGLPYINHLDHDRGNNSVSNLEWCTQQHNLAHARTHGRMTNYWEGRRGSKARFSDEQIAEIRRLYAAGDVGQKGLGKMFGVNKKTIFNIVKGATYAYVPLPPPPEGRT